MNEEVKVGDKVLSLVDWMDTNAGNIYTVARHSKDMGGIRLEETNNFLAYHEFQLVKLAIEEPKITSEPLDQGLIDKQEHYTANGIQPIDLMRQNFTSEAFQGFLEGNILKYVLRHRRKNGIEDLRKAMTYITWLIEEEEKK